MLAAAQLTDRLALDVQSAQALRAGARANDAETLRAAARQFEAMVVQMMLKTMRDTSFVQEGDVLGDSQSMRLYRDMMDQQWAQKMAAGKGLGFADMMVRAMDARTRAVAPEDMARLAQPKAEATSYPLDATRVGLPAVLPAGHAAPPQPSADAPDDGQAGGRDADTPDPGGGADAATAATDYRQRFLDRLRPHAQRVAAETGIPAHFILAHAALETGWGRHAIRTADGSDSHNLFGIKAGRSWSGNVAAQETTEYQHGLAVRRTESFRAYADYTEALRDYADVLGRRYQAACRAGTDATAFARGLAEGGYATDPDYAGKLQGVIANVAALEA